MGNYRCARCLRTYSWREYMTDQILGSDFMETWRDGPSTQVLVLVLCLVVLNLYLTVLKVPVLPQREIIRE